MRRRHCHLCSPTQIKISEWHVIAVCKGVGDVRRDTGVAGMLALYR